MAVFLYTDIITHMSSDTLLENTSSFDSEEVTPPDTPPIAQLIEKFRITQQPIAGQEGIALFMQSLAPPSDGRTKQDTYVDKLEEQRQKGIELVGFHEDQDFDTLLSTLTHAFGQEALDRCLIGKIIYQPDFVLLKDDGQHWEIPTDEYLQLLALEPRLNEIRVRAFNTAVLTQQPTSKQHQRMPIGLYSFVGESIGKPYLPSNMNVNEARRAYKLGTVIHEIGHSARYFLLTDELWQTWTAILKETPSLTSYASSYEQQRSWSDEQFAEALRLYATNRAHLQQLAPGVDGFIATNLPYLQPDILQQL